MTDKRKLEEVEALGAQTKDMVKNALRRLHEAVDSVRSLAEPDGVCPYTEKKCPLWEELARLRANQSSGH